MPAGQGELQHLAVIERALEFRMGSMGSSSRTMLMISGYSCWQDVDRRICLADDATVQVSHYAVPRSLFSQGAESRARKTCCKSLTFRAHRPKKFFHPYEPGGGSQMLKSTSKKA